MTKERPTSLADSAASYAQMKWKILPCHGINERNMCTCGEVHKDIKQVAKHPAILKWEQYSSSDLDDIEKWWHKNKLYNPALHCAKSGIAVIDIDPRSAGDVSFERLLSDYSISIPKTVEAYTGEYTYQGKTSRGRHIYFLCENYETLVGNLTDLGYPGIDIKHNGYVMLPPSSHFSGVQYKWIEARSPWDVEIAPMPEELLKILRKEKRGVVDYGLTATISESFLNDPKYKIDLAEILKTKVVEGERNITIFAVVLKVSNYFTDFGNRPRTEIIERAVFREVMIFNLNNVSPSLEQDEVEKLCSRGLNWVYDNPSSSYMSEEVKEWARRQQNITVDENKVADVLGKTSLEESASSKALRLQITESVRSGKSISESTNNGNIDIPSDPDAVYIEDGGTPGRRSFSDIGNGRRIVDLFGSGVAYTPDLGWKTWQDGYWKEDREGLSIIELAKKLPPIILSEGVQTGQEDRAKSWAKNSQSNARLKSAIDIAKSDPRVMVPIEAWDSQAKYFGAGNGIIDLSTGERLQGVPDLRISMRSQVDYIPGLKNQQWEQFLNETTDGNSELIEFLQKAAGYTMSGLSMLDRIFLVYGLSGTGKNTFMEAIFTAMGEYAATLETSIISASNSMSSSADMYHIASLHNKRLAWVDELPEGERFKENTMKKLSGSGMLTGRHPGGRPFTFAMLAKLWISSNHRPPIYDDAMWRRMYAIPFIHKPKNPDPQLKQYLSDPNGGAPGVLAWMVEGAIKVFNSKDKDLIGSSKVVDESTEIYRKNEDRISLFIEEEMVDAPGQAININALYNRYSAWAQNRGERPMSLGALSRKLMDKGVEMSGLGTMAVVVNKSLIGYKEMKTAVPPREEPLSFGTRNSDPSIIIFNPTSNEQ